MKVVIFCGGYGTRIRDVADDLPKPMIPLGNQPILWHIMKHYAKFGHKEFILCLGYKGQIIKEFFLNYDTQRQDFTLALGKNRAISYHNQHTELDWTVTLADTGLESLTATRLRMVQPYLAEDENFLLTYGDGVGNVDINALVEFHLNHKKAMTVTGVRPPGRFGELVSDANGCVTEFNEKPQASGGTISGGFFVCRKEVFSYLDPKANQMLEVEPMRKLAENREMVMFSHEGFWHPMDTYRDYSLLNSMIKEGNAPWISWK
ncbi:MAG: glucose-1-phosphate cytidylyltransferase [Verrucomicrobia bacterium]|nr:glucose-1-phosphate cytidylyltransferase [Verrucomicrobiota bacterium]